MFQSVLKRIGLFLAAIVMVVILFFIYFNLPGAQPREDVRLGMTFSSVYAEALGLDWKETYLALLDDLNIRELRIPVYWDRVEKEKGTLNYGDLDWQLSEAKKRNAKVILSIGQKVPRWPECHIPEWAKSDDHIRKQSLLAFIKETVGRYQGHEEVVMWQVENEPFLAFFGKCPKFDVDFLDQEITFVKHLDRSRPVLVTDSGELSLWYQAARRGDVFGTTLYRHIWKKEIGYYTYPIGPNFFRFKERMVRALTDQENFIVIELQAEPWASGWVADVPLEEQFRTMDETKLKENVEYAKRVGFDTIYLWGGEWWYWLKVKQNYPALWETGKELLRDHEKK